MLNPFTSQRCVPCSPSLFFPPCVPVQLLRVPCFLPPGKRRMLPLPPPLLQALTAATGKRQRVTPNRRPCHANLAVLNTPSPFGNTFVPLPLNQPLLQHQVEGNSVTNLSIIVLQFSITFFISCGRKSAWRTYVLQPRLRE